MLTIKISISFYYIDWEDNDTLLQPVSVHFFDQLSCEVLALVDMELVTNTQILSV